MNKHYTYLVALIISISALFSTSSTKAGIGDTTVVLGHVNAQMLTHGNYDASVVFPSYGTKTYSRILMKYRIGCPASGCSPWDYTTEVQARINTGQMDSTLATYPSFTVGAAIVDTFYYNAGITYTYYYNSTTQTTDSVPAAQQTVFFHADTAHPTDTTSTVMVYPANYYNYIYNATGTLIDSVFVGYSNSLIVNFDSVYTPFQVFEVFELGRVMTPYATGYPLTWGRDYWFDVTDYVQLLHDTVATRILYDGWSSGFTANVTYYFIEGTPNRNVKRVRNIYPLAYYKYGIATDPIENHLVAKTFDIHTDEKMALIRITPSGHSSDAQNCSEFCSKKYYLLIDGTSRFQQSVWRNDCGSNPIFAQPGTWVYNRANWCPGEKTVRREHELTPYIIPGDSVTIDMNFDPHTATSFSNPPGYIISAHLITYDTLNFGNDVSVEDIIAPNTEYNHNRFNPICSNPIITIKNQGAQSLTSCTIHYGIKGGTPQVYNWTGTLAFNQSTNVILGNLAWGSATNTPDQFEVWTESPNGVQDEYVYDDTLRSTCGFTSQLPSQFMLYWKTNNVATQNTYTLKDDQGNTLYASGSLTTNTIYKDTFNLSPGCYVLKITNSAGFGLSFPAGSNPYGTGFARLVKTNGTNAVIKTFTADFGTFITYYFTVGFTTGVDEITSDMIFQVAPNPSQGKFAINLILPKRDDVQINVLNQLGQSVYHEFKPGFTQEIMDIDMGKQAPGMYFVNVKTSSGMLTRKIIIE